MSVKYRKKMIEVALPLEAINKESAREKSIRHGHPSTLHLWWARRPLAACRAVLFSSLVNDPEDDPMYGIDKEIAYAERAKLFNLIEELIKWDNINNQKVINAARLEIARSFAANKVADKELKDNTPLVANARTLPEEQTKYMPAPPSEYTPKDVRFKMPGLTPEQVNHFLAHYVPPVLDPFAGGGSIPLEAQRLGLRAYASDLNPVPVLINKALIEIPPKFVGMPPVNPKATKGTLKSKLWTGAEGLADDVRYYGQWMRDEAEKRIGHLYPKVKVTSIMASDRPDLKPYIGKELKVVCSIWARTIPSPDPSAKGVMVPIVKSFRLSTKKGQEAWIDPVVDKTRMCYEFKVRLSADEPPEGTVVRGASRCLVTGSPMTREYIRQQSIKGNIGSRLMAIAVTNGRRRLFIDPLPDHQQAADSAHPSWRPDDCMLPVTRYTTPTLYGFEKLSDLFTNRQLATLEILTNLVSEVHGQIIERSKTLFAAQANDEYAKAVVTYLGLAVSKYADSCNSFMMWSPSTVQAIHLFSRHAYPMVWDYAEPNAFGDAAGDFATTVNNIVRAFEYLPNGVTGNVIQHDARNFVVDDAPIVSTDPPYYDNVPYADLSDFFYVFLRRALSRQYSSLMGTMLVPKAEELVADPVRQGGDDNAKAFFEKGMREFFAHTHAVAHKSAPITVFYAFKQAETVAEGESSTGWETMLEGLVASGLQVTGTWPVRSERSDRLRGAGSNALASSIVLVCRGLGDDAETVTRRDFATALRRELPEAIKRLQSGNVAPVDLAQASIGPGMAVFSRYKQVVNADGTPMSVREALQMINQILDESLNEQEADFDSETRFAIRWFEQYGMANGPFGDGETLAKAMAVAVSGVVDAGILSSKAGKVRLLTREQLDANWSPKTDRRSTIWMCTQHLIRRLESDGEVAAAELLADIQLTKGSEAGEVARELSYRLYSTCERKGWATDALSYNGLVVSWPEVSRIARDLKNKQPKPEQQKMFDE